MGSRDEGGVCTPPPFVICHGGTGWVVASGWGAAPADDGRHRVATGAGGAPAGHGNPRQPPGHFGRRPNWANAAGEPPARFRGTLRPTPALVSGRCRRRAAPGGDTAQRVRVVCRFEKVTYRCSPRTESISARRLSATRSCTCWQISTRCSRAASSSSPRRSCLGRAICL